MTDRDGRRKTGMTGILTGTAKGEDLAQEKRSEREYEVRNRIADTTRCVYMFRVVAHMKDMCRNTIDEFLSR